MRANMADGMKFGRYEVTRKLGQGGMASVYLAFDPKFRRNVAVKVISPTFATDPVFRRRFDREARAIATLEHAAIVPVYDYDDTEELPFLVFRYMERGSLAERIAEQGRIDSSDLASIARRVARALDYAHVRGIIHRDVKPSNIMFDGEDEAYLTDFGIAQLSDQTVSLTHSSLIGSPAYMSPEQCDGHESTVASDIYSFAVSLFESLTGRPPFTAANPLAVMLKHLKDPPPELPRSLVPEAVARTIEAALGKDPLARPSTASVIAEAFRSAPIEQARPQQPLTAQVEDTRPREVDEPAVFPSPVEPAVDAVPAAPELAETRFVEPITRSAVHPEADFAAEEPHPAPALEQEPAFTWEVNRHERMAQRVGRRYWRVTHLSRGTSGSVAVQAQNLQTGQRIVFSVAADQVKLSEGLIMFEVSPARPARAGLTMDIEWEGGAKLRLEPL
jgi:hypothetical protein